MINYLNERTYKFRRTCSMMTPKQMQKYNNPPNAPKKPAGYDLLPTNLQRMFAEYRSVGEEEFINSIKKLKTFDINKFIFSKKEIKLLTNILNDTKRAIEESSVNNGLKELKTLTTINEDEEKEERNDLMLEAQKMKEERMKKKFTIPVKIGGTMSEKQSRSALIALDALERAKASCNNTGKKNCLKRPNGMINGITPKKKILKII